MSYRAQKTGFAAEAQKKVHFIIIQHNYVLQNMMNMTLTVLKNTCRSVDAVWWMVSGCRVDAEPGFDFWVADIP